jgi:signal transduction histidine kinase
MSSKPVYVLSHDAHVRSACAAALPGQVETPDPAAGVESLLERSAGVLLLDAGALGAAELVSAAERLTRAGWTVAVFSGNDPVTVRTVSVGYETELDGVGRFVGHVGDGAEDLLDLHRVLEEIARARHDINNPLTSALAETQILLLDAPDGEMRESLETIQTQLRRIRDLVATTRHMRPRR